MYIRYFKIIGMIEKINIGMQYAKKIELSITIIKTLGGFMSFSCFRSIIAVFAIVLLVVFLIDPASAKEGYCQKGISLQKIERLSGQGIGEGKFELTVKATLPSRNISASTGQLKLGSGQTQYPDLHIGTLWVPMDGSSYKQTLQTEAIEHEVGKDKFVGGTDRGRQTSKITVKCGTSNQIEQKIKIKGRKTGKIKVTYVVGDLERDYAKQGQALSRNVVTAQYVTREVGVNRGGMDYRNFKLDNANPGICAQQCADENQCKAFTYVPPGHQGNKARCWLKDRVPGKSTKRGLVSGVKMNARVPMESNLNLPGRDYSNFDLPKPEPALCASACAKDPQCEAYTYVRPGYQGQQARCWLKDSVPNRRSDNCCVSGVKQTN